jgi:hypothetical protein
MEQIKRLLYSLPPMEANKFVTNVWKFWHFIESGNTCHRNSNRAKYFYGCGGGWLVVTTSKRRSSVERAHKDYYKQT